MPDRIVYVDTSKIRGGKLDELKVAMRALVAFMEKRNPRVISYGFYLDEDAASMSVVAVHPDSDALKFHLDVGEAEFRSLADLVELSSIAVYGTVSDAVLERLNQKAQSLGSGTVTVHQPQAVFAR